MQGTEAKQVIAYECRATILYSVPPRCSERLEVRGLWPFFAMAYHEI